MAGHGIGVDRRKRKKKVRCLGIKKHCGSSNVMKAGAQACKMCKCEECKCEE